MCFMIMTLLATLAQSQRSDTESESSYQDRAISAQFKTMRSDLKHLRCPVCQEMAKALHAEVSKLPKTMKAKKNKHARPSEEAVAKVVQKVCSPSSEAGTWLKTLDVVESSGGLQCEQMGSAGKVRDIGSGFACLLPFAYGYRSRHSPRHTRFAVPARMSHHVHVVRGDDGRLGLR